jgi:predicted GH43/DUF377 family glycosyl hydrolase
MIRRFEQNPILTAADVPYQVATVHNAGAVKHEGRYLLLFRSHRRNGRSLIGLAESDDGIHFSARPDPFLVPATEGAFAEYEEWGVEDVRICPLEGEYLLTYSAYSRHGVRVALARTADFRRVERVALITPADTRNVVIFPERINGRYVRLDRPHSELSPWSIWISYSPDLVHWGDSRVVMKPLSYHWDEQKIGPGATPIRTARGWLHLYHGVFPTMAGAVYRLGVALHDLTDPARVLGVADEWVLEPEDPWERVGYVPNVVFTCGAIPEEDGTVKVYWGGADTVMCGGTAVVDELVDMCLERPRPPL